MSPFPTTCEPFRPELCSVKVAVRVRPPSLKESSLNNTEPIQLDAENSQIIAGRNRLFSFDNVFNPSSTQYDVYNYVSPLVDKFLDGFNATIFAYGQTGSGKTFTMGTGTSASACNEEKWGILPRIVYQLFSKLKSTREFSDFKVKCSYVEIYNEEIRDLLNPEANPRSIFIREDAKGEIFLAGVKEMEVQGMKEMIDLSIKGSMERKVGNTSMNESSSRSHAIFTIMLHHHPCSPTANEKSPFSSKFHLVDLAGSERLKKTGAVGVRLKESVTINSGLLALGNVINALCDEKKKSIHIPYRDSKLTRMLQNSLGGNSQTVMIACISNLFVDFNETLNTLKYANRARSIQNQIFLNPSLNSNDVNSLKSQLTLLHQQVMKIKSKSLFKVNSNVNSDSNKSNHKASCSLKEAASLKKKNELLIDQCSRLQSLLKSSQSELKRVVTDVSNVTFERNMLQEKLSKINIEILNLLKNVPSGNPNSNLNSNLNLKPNLNLSSNSNSNLNSNTDHLLSSLKLHFLHLHEKSKNEMIHNRKLNQNGSLSERLTGIQHNDDRESKSKLFGKFRNGAGIKSYVSKFVRSDGNSFKSNDSKANVAKPPVNENQFQSQTPNQSQNRNRAVVSSPNHENGFALLQEKVKNFEICLKDKDRELEEAREDLKKDEWIFKTKSSEIKILNSKVRQLLSEREKYDVKSKTYANTIFKLEQQVFAKDEEIKRLKMKLDSDDESSHGFCTDGSF